MTIVLARVDNRLIHGQVLEMWIPATRTTTIVVVDDSIADDSLRQSIMEIALPKNVTCKFVHVAQVKSQLENGNLKDERVMLLFAGIKEALGALRDNISIESLNVGNIHYSKGKRRLTNSVSLSKKELSWLREIDELVHVEIKSTPNDDAMTFMRLLQKYDDAAGVENLPGTWFKSLLLKIFSR